MSAEVYICTRCSKCNPVGFECECLKGHRLHKHSECVKCGRATLTGTTCVCGKFQPTKKEDIIISTQGRGGGKTEAMELETLRRAIEVYKKKSPTPLMDALKHLGTFRFGGSVFPHSIPLSAEDLYKISHKTENPTAPLFSYDEFSEFNIQGWNLLTKLEKKMQKPDYDFKVSAEELFDVLEVSNELSRSNYALYVRTAQVKDPIVNCILIHRSVIHKAKSLGWGYCYTDSGMLTIASFNMIPLEDHNFKVNLTSAVNKKVVMDWVHSVKNARLPKEWRKEIQGMDGITINVKALK